MERNDNEEGLKLKPQKIKPKLPSIYKVIILNDDFTPMEFVANINSSIYRFNYDSCCWSLSSRKT